MRKMLLVISAGAIMLAASPAHAQTYDPSYPICMKVYGSGIGGGEYNECRYTSIAQCNATASGRAATCMINPWYAPDPTKRSQRRTRRVYG